MTDAPAPPTAGARSTGAATGILLTIAAYKLLVIGRGRPLAWAEGLVLDLGFVAALWLIALTVRRSALPGARWVGRLLFWPLAILWFAANFGYTYFFTDAADRHYSMLNVSLHEVAYFFRDLLPLSGWMWLALLCIGALLTARWAAKHLHPVSLRRPALGTALLVGGALTVGASAADIPNPAMDIARDVRERWSDIAVDAATAPVAAGPITQWDRSATSADPLRTRFSRIVVVVMETMPFDTYRAELAALPANNILRVMERSAHRFERYFTPNQDSRTAMLDMLLSRYIPYEAYDDATFPFYEKSSTMTNLPAYLHANGYETMYALAQEDEEEVVAELPWQRLLKLSPARIDTLKQHALCYHPYQFENSCEDKVLLPDIVQFLAGHEQAFVYQEMMWGHALEYNRASGKGNVQYVAEFVDSLWKELARRHLDDKTLLVVTGDHGDKAEDRRHVATNYQVPLFFYAPSFTLRVDRAMYTHLDFKDLLLRELEPARTAPAPSSFVQVVGPTDSHLRYVVDSAGRLLEFRMRGARSFVSYASGTTGAGALDAAAHLRMYEEYRHWFERVVPRAAAP